LGVVPCGGATLGCIGVCLYTYNVSNTIILVNKGFIKGFPMEEKANTINKIPKQSGKTPFFAWGEL
jgi:hypothetical protein